jgi:hypothetical protein
MACYDPPTPLKDNKQNRPKININTCVLLRVGSVVHCKLPAQQQQYYRRPRCTHKPKYR